MTLLAVILVFFLIWRLYKILKLLGTPDFWLSLIPLLSFMLAAATGSIILYIITFIILICLKYVEFIQYNTQTLHKNISNGWAFASWIAMTLFLGILFLWEFLSKHGNTNIQSINIIVACLLGGIFMIYSKLFRVPWFILLHIMLLGLSVYNLASQFAPTVSANSNTTPVSDLSQNDIGPDLLVDNTSTLSGMTFQDSLNVDTTVFNSIPLTDGLFDSTFNMLNQSLTLYGGFSNYTQGFIDINPFLYNNISNIGQDLIINNGLGIPQLSFNDGTITDLTQNVQIGTYGTDSSLNMDSIYDNDKNIILAMDSNGTVYDSQMLTLGTISKNSEFTVFTDIHGETTTYLHSSGTMFDNKNHLLASIKKC